ncbi:MAG: CBS domain-containing protein [Acidobacteria bacterium]|nr:CBS domain-containing protein [Acidobacteriota bacterium]
MRLNEVMTEGVQTVAPTMAASDAWELMRRKQIHHVVVTRGSDVIGILSDRDAGSRAGAGVRSGRTVAELMTSHAVTLSPEDTVRKAANLMRGRTIGCLPVTDKRGRLVGIVTVSDLLDLLGKGGDRQAKPQRPSATHRVPHRKRHRAYGAW